MDHDTLRRLDYWEEAPVGSDAAIQAGQVWVTEDRVIDVEIRLTSQRQPMPFGWQNHVRKLIKQRVERGALAENVIRLRFTDIFT